MTVDSALKIAEAFDFNAPASEDDIFEFTEAMNFLITETKEPRYGVNGNYICRYYSGDEMSHIRCSVVANDYF